MVQRIGVMERRTGFSTLLTRPVASTFHTVRVSNARAVAGMAIASMSAQMAGHSQVVLKWSKAMHRAFQFDTPADKMTIKTQALIDDLERRVNLLNSDIKEEEARTTIRDLANPFYPILTRNLRSRRDNLLATIAILRTQLERSELEFAE
jgi:hypothetical protein